MNLKDYADKGMTYPQFRDMHAQLIKENKTTGENQTETYLNYARLNQHRMERLEKTLHLQPALEQAVKALPQPVTALVITEGWCGDSAQNVPVLNAMEKASPRFKTRIVLRDENPDLMDRYLTNGSRSIPKVVFINEQGQELGTWGPRPQAAQQIMLDARARNLAKEDMATELHTWYSRDKTHSMQDELLALLEGFDRAR